MNKKKSLAKVLRGTKNLQFNELETLIKASKSPALGTSIDQTYYN